ncbi:hypothetical protein U0070_020042 [Myodes glareolus]|uniref:Uncharacterized protein n=1 Tax=Myodes glareolus TaxID=447135 RepID=A0AAW0HD80_MYOGA
MGALRTRSTHGHEELVQEDLRNHSVPTSSHLLHGSLAAPVKGSFDPQFENHWFKVTRNETGVDS